MSHAVLAPSGAERWLSCPPSARLEQQFPDKGSEAAKEGTLAHLLAEVILAKKINKQNKFQASVSLKKIESNPLYQTEMKGYIDDYTARVIECYSNAQAHTKDAQIFLEQKLNLTEYVPEGFGTGDVVIIANTILDLIDLKYGKGVPVSAENNKQMMLYALGALREFDCLYDIQTVRMTIDQPRLDSVSIWEISVEDLRKWANEELKPRAALAFKGIGEYKAGSHCRFCKAKGICKANADYNLELARYDFAEGPLLKDEEVTDILQRADVFRKWLTAVEEYSLEEAVNNGKKWPGLKLVEGRSNRQYTDPIAIAEKLVTSGIETEKIYEPKKLLGITAMEKAIGKNVFQDLLSPFITKPPGKPALVPINDKRNELNSAEAAKADFAEVVE